MKVLLLLGLIIATVWAYPVADSEVSTSTVVVDYSAVAKDSQSHEHQAKDYSESSESQENSSEEKIEEPKIQAVKDQNELRPLADDVKSDSSEESNEDDKHVVEVKPEIAQDVVQDDLVVPTLPKEPKIEEKPAATVVQAPLQDKVEEPVEAPEVPVALPTVSGDATDHKEAKAEDGPLKLEEIPAPIQSIVEEEIKVAASEINVVEEQKVEIPKLVKEETIIPVEVPLPVSDEVDVEQDTPIAIVPDVPVALSQEVPIADLIPANQPIEIEKKERKNAPVLTTLLVQEEPIPQETPVEIPQPDQVKEEVLEPVAAPAADLPGEPQQSLTLSLPALPAVIVKIQPDATIIPEEPLNVPVVELPADLPLPEVSVEPAEQIVPVQKDPVALLEQVDPIVPILSEPVVPVIQSEPIAADLPQAAEAPVEPQPNPVEAEKELQQVQETQQSKVTQEAPQVEPAVMIPEAPTFASDLQATPTETISEQPVKVEETPVVVPLADVADVKAPAVPIYIEPEARKDLSQETR